MLRVLLVCSVLFAGFHSAFADETLDRLKKSIEITTDKAELGRLHKQLGDYYRFKNRLNEAAEEYSKALSLARETLSLEDRRQIAVSLSWAGRLKESITELKAVIAQDPANVEARIHLARVLSWVGELAAAVKEADGVLRDSPGNRDAMLVKANALRWRGDVKMAIPLYRKLLEQREDFDARLGLSFALLAGGDIKGAREGLKVLQRSKPKFAYQEKELKELVKAVERATP